MASEKAIIRVLDLLTTPKGEGLPEAMQEAVGELQQVLEDKNTVGVALGLKIRGKGRIEREKVVTFLVEKKKPATRLRAAEFVPPTIQAELSGGEAIGTDVVEVGKVVPEVNKTRSPLQPGYSIGHVKVTAGTFGGVASKGKRYQILSNSHVLALSGKAKNGDKVLYPGKADGGNDPKDVAAKLSGFKKFTTGGAYVNRVDCAVATPLATRLKDLRSEIKGLGVPKGTAAAKLGMTITKTGRTTGTTTGRVTALSARLRINYPGVGQVGFRDQVLCTRYSKPGDSGSLVLDKATKRAVGLHFAGGPGGSFFNPIDTVLKTLRVKLVTKPIKRGGQGESLEHAGHGKRRPHTYKRGR